MKEEYYESAQDDHTYTIRIGSTAQENWDLIDDSKQNDIWFHVDDHPSCHVVLSVEKIKKPHKAVLNRCAALCKDGSKMKNNKNITIIYTKIKNVKKGKDVGSVIAHPVEKIVI